MRSPGCGLASCISLILKARSLCKVLIAATKPVSTAAPFTSMDKSNSQHVDAFSAAEAAAAVRDTTHSHPTSMQEQSLKQSTILDSLARHKTPSSFSSVSLNTMHLTRRPKTSIMYKRKKDRRFREILNKSRNAPSLKK